MEMDQNVTVFDEFLPVAGVKDGAVLSKRGDVTVGFEVTLPPAFSLGTAGYEALNDAFASAVAALRDAPFWVMIHRQDVYRNAAVPAGGGDGTLLGDAEAGHFAGREYLTHRHFLFLTMTSPSSALRPLKASGVFGQKVFSRVTPSGQDLQLFGTMAREFASVFSAGGVTMTPLSDTDLAGDGEGFGLIEEYIFGRPCVYSDIRREPDCVFSGGKCFMGYDLCESGRMPSFVGDTVPVRELCGEGGDLVLSSSSPMGLRLGREHILNQYILVPRQDVTLASLEKRSGRMRAMGKYSDNEVNAEGIEGFVRTVKQDSLTVVYSAQNVIFWGDTREEALAAGGDVRAAFSMAGAQPLAVTRDFPVLWYSGIPGAECEMGADHLMLGELRAAAAQGTGETFDDGLGEGVLHLTDRMRHNPVRLDTQAAAYSRKLITNYNMFVIGPSGTGKSFTMNKYVNACYAAGESVFIIDVGASYELQCLLHKEESAGADGQYYTWDRSKPLRFNPLASWRHWQDGADGDGDEGGLGQSGFQFFVSLLKVLWTPAGGWTDDLQNILYDIVTRFVSSWEGKRDPVFDDFFHFVSHSVKDRIKYRVPASSRGDAWKRKAYLIGTSVITEERFDIDSFTVALQPYSGRERYGYLLNNAETDDLFSSRFICFDLKALAAKNADRTFYSVVVFCMMNAFDLRMRSLTGFKTLVVDEAWQAIDNPVLGDYLKGLWKTARKYSTACVVVTQEIADVVSSPVLKTAVVDNSDVKLLLQQKDTAAVMDQLRRHVGLGDREADLVRSVGRGVSPVYGNREVFVSLGGRYCGVYGIEACPEELLVYESELEKKEPIKARARELDSLRAAVRELAGGKNTKR